MASSRGWILGQPGRAGDAVISWPAAPVAKDQDRLLSAGQSKQTRFFRGAVIGVALSLPMWLLVLWVILR